MLNDVFSGLAAVGALATAAAVWVGIRQLGAAEREFEESRRQTQTSFEDGLTREYRAIVGDLPAEAFYLDDSNIDLDESRRRAFYRYFDLCNEQLFLARFGRVSPATAAQWRDGISGNLGLPAFDSAWRDVEPHVPSDFFEDLRELIASPPQASKTISGAHPDVSPG